jgi:preprotein translocase subunit YajC
MIIPDFVMPVVGYRVWRWDVTGLNSLNGEPWIPGLPLAAGCRGAIFRTIAGLPKAVHDPREIPHADCTCGIYAARSLEHLRQIGYERRGICGEVCMWGTVVEHKLGWRAQFAYPKSFFLPPNAIPFRFSEIEARLERLIAFGAELFLLRDHENIHLWNKDAGFDMAGLNYLIKTRQEYYARQRRERTLKKGDRVALLGHGIAVVEQIEGKEARVVLGKRLVLRIPRNDIVLNQQYMRWECEVNNVRDKNAFRELSPI